jgi:RimJ/RimL family protein N-acetyltransferase
MPTELRTARLLLRPWRTDDALALKPILERDIAHLGPWIPAHVAQPAPLPELEERLAGFAADFANDLKWRYALVTLDTATLLGEVGLFPRSPTGRVPFADADRVELGYWLRSDATGHGFVSEAARVLLDVAAGLPEFSCVEIRCDARNAPSAAIPRRFGFRLAATEPLRAPTGDRVSDLQIWELKLAQHRQDAETTE